MKRLYYYLWFPKDKLYFNEDTFMDSKFGTRYKDLKTIHMIVNKYELRNYKVCKCFY